MSDEEARVERPADPEPSWLGIAVLVSALYAVAVLLLGVAAESGSAALVVTAIAATVVLAVAAQFALRRHRRSGARPHLGVPLVWIGVGAGLVAIWWWRREPEALGFVGASAMFLGAGHALAIVRRRDRVRRWRGPAVLAACAASTAAGAALLVGGAGPRAVALVAAGVLVSPVGLALASEDLADTVVERHAGRHRARWVALAGAGAVAGGAAWLVLLGAPVATVVAVVAVLGVLVAAITVDGPADTVLVVAVLALGWASLPRSSGPAEPGHPTSGSVVAAIGDSYMSGEGAQVYDAGTNTARVNECRRAPTAYPPLAVADPGSPLPDQLVFLACSGAEIAEVTTEPQYPGEPIDGRDGGLPQLGNLAATMSRGDAVVEVVLVSIGGNDAGFGDLARTCVGPGDCTELAAPWLARLDGLDTVLVEAYEEIDRATGDARVLVVPYPVPLRDTGCRGSPFGGAEHRFLHGFTTELNAEVTAAAQRAGVEVVTDVERALADADLRLCETGDPGVNAIAANPVQGLLEERVNPLTWFHNSLHPDELGHRTLRDALLGWLAANPTAGGEPDPTAPRHRVATLEELMGDPDFEHCGREGTAITDCDDEGRWVASRSVAAAVTVLPALLAAVAGWWAISLAALVTWRRRHRTTAG